MDFQLTIIVPIYNEEDNLFRLEKELLSFSEVAIKKTKILLINDGSTDISQALIEEICERNNIFNFIQLKKNYGLSAAIKAGFDNCNTTFIGYIDADLQTDPKDFNKLLEFCDNYDLVTGYRNNRKDSFIKKLSSKTANSVRRAFTKDDMHDTGCPLKIMKTKSAQNIPMFKGLHRFLPAMILLQNGNVKQVPINHYPRIAGKSKFGVWNRLIGPLIDCFVYLWMKRKYINYTVQKKN
ncbi:glycosyltransferase [Pontimicrobium sp. IMCC45349]|uniref:glycosyltransferase n=1 Tax=Pontimicrobium sp. IMCC45349 TaxID=3391574 RepID=UPI00399F2B07